MGRQTTRIRNVRDSHNIPWPIFNEATGGYFGYRFYHDTDHIDDLLTKLDKVRVHARRPDLIELAILYHDAVYNTDQSDALNVDQSAALFCRHAESLRINGGRVARSYIEGLIRSTDGHVPHAFTARQAFPECRKRWLADYENDVRLILDLDLSAFAWPRGDPWLPRTFDSMTKNIRLEYLQYNDQAFAIGRAAALQKFVERADRDQLFLHPATRALYNEAGKTNLRESAAFWADEARRLTGQPDGTIDWRRLRQAALD